MSRNRLSERPRKRFPGHPGEGGRSPRRAPVSRSRMPDCCPSCWKVGLPNVWLLSGDRLIAVYRCECGRRWKCYWSAAFVRSDLG